MKELQNKHLVIFDFDETLCKTNGKITCTSITQPSVEMKHLTPSEYSEFRESGDYNEQTHKLDFKDFIGYPKNGEPILPVLTCIFDALKSEHYLVALVTGRDELSGPKAWLNDNFVDTSKMILLCSGDPNKRMCYESLVNTYEPTNVTIYEDCKYYIAQCEEVCAKYQIPCASVLVLDGEIKWNWRQSV
jgi:hypothetical protein